MHVDAMLRSGRPREVLAQAHALVRAAPLRERRWELLVLAQYQTGAQGEALRSLRQLRAVLARELGIDPSPEMLALEQSILQQDPRLLVPQPRAATRTVPLAGAQGVRRRRHRAVLRPRPRRPVVPRPARVGLLRGPRGPVRLRQVLDHARGRAGRPARARPPDRADHAGAAAPRRVDRTAGERRRAHRARRRPDGGGVRALRRPGGAPRLPRPPDPGSRQAPRHPDPARRPPVAGHRAPGLQPTGRARPAPRRLTRRGGPARRRHRSRRSRPDWSSNRAWWTSSSGRCATTRAHCRCSRTPCRRRGGAARATP